MDTNACMEKKQDTTWTRIQKDLKDLFELSAGIRDLSGSLNQRILLPTPEPPKQTSVSPTDSREGPVFGYILGAIEDIRENLNEARGNLTKISREL